MPISQLSGLQAELTPTNPATRQPGKVKWPDVTLKRGLLEMPPLALLKLRAGEQFSLQLSPRSTPAEVSAAQATVNQPGTFDLTVADPAQPVAVARASKVDAFAFEQNLSAGGPIVEIQLRKL